MHSLQLVVTVCEAAAAAVTASTAACRPDPPYGHAQNFRPPPELGSRVYAFSPATGAVAVVAEGFVMPNGLAFSPDFRTLYVTDTGEEEVSVSRQASRLQFAQQSVTTAAPCRHCQAELAFEQVAAQVTSPHPVAPRQLMWLLTASNSISGSNGAVPQQGSPHSKSNKL